MSVMDYNVQFMRLSRYVPRLVATEQLRVQRFIEGLKSYLFKAIAGHGDMTYQKALNRALTIERGNRNKGGASRDSRKRPRSENLMVAIKAMVVEALEMLLVRAVKANREVGNHRALNLARQLAQPRVGVLHSNACILLGIPTPT